MSVCESKTTLKSCILEKFQALIVAVGSLAPPRVNLTVIET